MGASESALAQIFSVAGAAWTGTVILGLVVLRMWSGLPQILDKWLDYRTARAAEKAADWTRLRDEITRLREWCAELQHEVDECRRREGEWMSRAIAAEAAHLGFGEASQQAQRILSEERTKDKPKEK